MGVVDLGVVVLVCIVYRVVLMRGGGFSGIDGRCFGCFSGGCVVWFAEEWVCIVWLVGLGL